MPRPKLVNNVDISRYPCEFIIVKDTCIALVITIHSLVRVWGDTLNVKIKLQLYMLGYALGPYGLGYGLGCGLGHRLVYE